MIKETNTDCKITDISVVGSTATLTCLFFANNKTEKAVGLRFLFIDLETEEVFQLDNTTYWVDSINSTDSNLLNVSINGYKEVRLVVDITNNNTASMQKSRWYRKGYLILTDITDVYNKPLWQSETFSLVSEQISIPKIKDLFIYNKPVYVDVLSETENRIFIEFKYEYDIDVDFTYNNSNLKTFIIIKSISTGAVIETIEPESSQYIKAESSLGYTYNEPVAIDICVTNLKKEVLKQFSVLYKPFTKKACGYVKTAYGVKKIKRLIVKDSSQLIVNPNNFDVKISYDTPIYAHYDRYTYTKMVRNPNTLREELVTYHRCVLHIDTFLSETNFKNVVYEIINNGNIVASQNTDVDETTYLIQNDSNLRIDVEKNSYTINATYTSETTTKNIVLAKINKTIVCSKKLKVHNTLYPFNYESVFGQEVNDNE
jgi:hypothetical protein